MGLFKPYDPQPIEDGHPEPSPASAKTPVKKGTATPTRRQAEIARRNRISPNLTAKQAKRKAQDEATRKMHAQPYNQLIRDTIDHRMHLMEFMMPILLLLLLVFMFGGYVAPALMMWSNWVFFGFLLTVILDGFITWREVRRNLTEYFPHEPLKGKLSYAMNRMMQMRRGRVPPPRVKRGTPFVWPPDLR